MIGGKITGGRHKRGGGEGGSMAGVESKHFTLSFFMPGQFKTQRRRGGEHPQIRPREGTLLYYTHRMPAEKEKEEKEGGLNCSRGERKRMEERRH